ncbi:MAG TPA: polysaccharide biosynthesis tyrosine autokinase [Thermodesulfovibrionales bacterium]|nr:polysaccharide biosynthesis tyrosine autokinase [Thermodesulfovibrionales bacterium]
MGAFHNDPDDKTILQNTVTFPVGFPQHYPFQQEEELHLRDYWSIIMRRKWIVIAFLLIVVSTVAIVTFHAKSIYMATTTLKIEKEHTITGKMGEGAYEPDYWYDDETFYQTQLMVLKSKSLATRVVRSMKLGREPKLSANPDSAEKKIEDIAATAGISPVEEDVDSNLVNGFMGGLVIAQEPKTRVIRLSYVSENPDFAAKAVNATARTYIDFNLENKFEATLHAKESLEKQLEEMKAKVERAEEALNRYVAQNGIVLLTETASASASDKRELPGPSESIMSKRLTELSSQLLLATTERITKESLYREALRTGSDVYSSVINANPQVQSARKDYANLQTEYLQQSKIYKPDYPKMVRLKEQMNQLKGRIDDEVSKAVLGLKGDYEAAVKKEESLHSAFDKLRKETLDMNDKMVQYQILKREADTNRELYSGLLQKLKEVGVTATISASNITILDRAEVPKSPYKPDRQKNLALALVLGLFGGLGLAFFVDYLDNTLKTPEDIERIVHLPSLGFVPSLEKKTSSKILPLITLDNTKSPITEAFRSIGTYIMFSSAVRPPKTILVTSPQKGDGKTTTVVNLALSLSQSYGKCIVVDADMRRPKLHKVLEVNNTVGLSSFLSGQIEFGDNNGFIKKTKFEKLDVITHGVIPPDPSELLSSHRMRDLINALVPFYQFIILDSPPVLGLADSLIMSTFADGVILVAKAGDTPKDAASHAKKLLLGINAKILGIILNQAKESHLKYRSYYHYYSHYYEDSDKVKTKRRKKDTA